MKDLHRLLAAAALGAGAAIAGSSLAQSDRQPALALVADHMDRRFDRLERGLGALSSNVDTELGNVRIEIQNDCPSR